MPGTAILLASSGSVTTREVAAGRRPHRASIPFAARSLRPRCRSCRPLMLRCGTGDARPVRKEVPLRLLPGVELSSPARGTEA
jgi:hypothetical protein